MRRKRGIKLKKKPTVYTYPYLCIPLKGDAKILDGNKVSKLVGGRKFSGLIIGYRAMSGEVHTIYEHTNGIAQGRYAIYDFSDRLAYEGFYVAFGGISLTEGELLSYMYIVN